MSVNDYQEKGERGEEGENGGGIVVRSTLTLMKEDIDKLTVELIAETAGDPYGWIDTEPETAKCSLMEIAAFIEYANKLKERMKDE